MSQATKRKHVVKEALEELVVPTAQQQIVRVSEGPRPPPPSTSHPLAPGAGSLIP